MFADNSNRLYHACQIKEILRLFLKIKDTKEAEVALKRWVMMYLQKKNAICDDMELLWAKKERKSQEQKTEEKQQK